MQPAADIQFARDLFAINQPAASAACADASRAMLAGDYEGAQRKLIEAIRQRPSCALAYKLMSDLLRASNNAAAADVCARNLLPDSMLSQYFSVSSPPERTATEFSRTHVVASVEVEIPAPNAIEESPAFTAQILKSSPCFVDILKSASLWHDDANTVIFDSNGAELRPHSVGSVPLLRTLCVNHKPLPIHGRAILLGAKGAHNFYHWITDIIPKISLLINAGIQIDSSDTFIVSRGSAHFARQLLDVFNIKPEQIIETEFASPYISAEELVVPRLENKMGYTMGAWLPKQLKTVMQVEDKPANNQRIFVNRNPATSAGRTLSNAAEVEAWFIAKGFKCVYPETLTVTEQAKLFASASVVAGIHGAGLANIVYCKPGTKVIEFYGEHIAPCYWIISALSGLVYYQHRGDSVGQSSNTTKGSRHSAGFELPLAEAQTLLDYAQI